MSLAGGAARVGFGFGVGLLIHRARGYLPQMGRKGALLALAALLYFLALPLPAIGWQLAVVLICMPAVLLLAVSAGRASVVPGGALLGRLSYPVYGTHFPLLALWAGAFKFAGGGSGGHWAALLLALPLLAAASAVLVWFDEPLRAWLSRRWLAWIDSGSPVRPFRKPVLPLFGGSHRPQSG